MGGSFDRAEDSALRRLVVHRKRAQKNPGVAGGRYLAGVRAHQDVGVGVGRLE